MNTFGSVVSFAFRFPKGPLTPSECEVESEQDQRTSERDHRKNSLLLPPSLNVHGS